MSQKLVEWYRNYEPYRGLQVFSTTFQNGNSSFSFMPRHPAVYNYDIATKGVNFYAAEKGRIDTNYETGWRSHDYPDFGMMIGPANRVCQCDFSHNKQPINVFVLSVDGDEANKIVADLGSFDRLDYGELHNAPIVDTWTAQAYMYMAEKVTLKEANHPLFHESFIAAFVRNAFTLGRQPNLRNRVRERLSPRDLLLTLDYVDTNFNTELTLQELAGLSGYSKYHFLRAFGNTVGIPPYRYVMTRRVKNAVSLLQKTRHTIPEIAQMTGFADQAHLTRQVRRFTGQTPAKLRGEKLLYSGPTEKKVLVN